MFDWDEVLKTVGVTVFGTAVVMALFFLVIYLFK